MPILRYLSTACKHRVAKNFAALAMMNGIGYLIPVITLPYIVRVIGIETYGRLAFATATIVYFTVITDYGFTLSATRDIAANKDNYRRLSEIYSSVFIIKFLLMAFSLLLLSALILAIPLFRKEAALLYVAFGLVLGNVLMPIWFFQGIQQMGYITALDLGAKVLFAGLLFLLVKSPSDYLLVPALTGLGFIASGIAGLIIIKKQFGVGFSFPGTDALREQLYGGWHVFTTRVLLNLYTTTNIVLLGLFTNPVIVGQYSVAEKVIGVLKSIFNAANQAIYPHLVTKWKGVVRPFYRLIGKLTVITIAASIGIVVSVYFLADQIVTLIAGNNDQTIRLLLMVLLLSLIIAPLGGLYTNSLIVVGKVRQFQRIMFWTALINILMVVPAILIWGAVGLAVSTVVITTFVITSCIIEFFRIHDVRDNINGPFDPSV